MSGTKQGGLKARDTNYKKHGKDFFRNIGRIGGKNGHTGGFASNPVLASEAGRKGGLKSSRKGIMNGQGKKAKRQLSDIEKYAEIYA